MAATIASVSTSIPSVPIRTDVVSDDKKATRTWIIFFEQLIAAIGGIGGLSALIPSPVHEVPAGTIDGSNTVFTLTYAPLGAWLVLELDNALEDPTSDYTLSSNTITYAQAPQVGDVHHAWYFRGAQTADTTTVSVAATTAAATSLISTKVGLGKILNGTISGTPAGTWMNASFDDSAWAAPVASPAPTAPVTGAEMIADTTGSRTGQPYAIYHRYKFFLPAGAISSASWKWTVDDQLNQIWVNGTSCTVGSVSPTSNPLPANLFIPGAENIIAVKYTDIFASVNGMSYVVTVN